MDTGTLHAVATVLAFVAFTSVCLWTYSGKRRNGFTEAANLPFADEPEAATRKPHDRGNQP